MLFKNVKGVLFKFESFKRICTILFQMAQLEPNITLTVDLKQ